MNRGIALLVAVVVLAGIVTVAPVGMVVAQDDPVATNETSETNETTDISPGEHLSGVVGVQNAEISGEVESRAFEIGLNRSDTDRERAEIVAERLNRTEQRLAEIEQRQRELRERRDAGELSQGAYAARMAETSARAENIRREANRSANVARDLPEQVRAQQGIDEERLTTLRKRANNASGPEIAAIARGVTGTDVGGPLAPERRGPPSTPPADGTDRPGSGGEPPGGAGEPPTHETDGASGNATNATRGSETRGQSEVGDTIDVGGASGPNVTSEPSTTDGANDSTGTSTNVADDGTDRPSRNESAADGDDADGGDADGVGDRSNRGTDRESPSMTEAVGDLPNAVDTIVGRLTEVVVGGYDLQT